MTSLTRLALASSCAFGFAMTALPAFAVTGAEVLENTCSACHVTGDDGKIDRIDAVRKTPEAWDMTVVRMMRNHQVALTDEERLVVVRHLSDTRGLTVAETEGLRYILEREPVATDAGPSELMTQTCSRCHSYARVALQRRTAQDWEHLINFHLGQFPTLEYQALARDRDWWGIAQTEIHDFLSKTYPLGEAPAAYAGDRGGTYVLAGRQPGQGDYTGRLTITPEGDDYAVEMVLAGATERRFSGKGRMMGAGEWRASLSDGTTDIRQVFAVAEDGTISGRWFERDYDVTGGRITAVKEGGAAQVLAVAPARLKIGEATEIRVSGPALGEALTLPEGVSGTVTAATADGVTLSLTATGAPRAIALDLGGQKIALAAFETIDRISVVPELTLARVGDGGGALPKVPAQFEAMGWLNGPDGKPATEDDIALGAFAARWSLDNFDQAAIDMKDTDFAGAIDETGLFMPADAGPNPARPMSSNNLGNLKVIAEVTEGAQTLTGEAHLYSTVQRFVDAPIR